MSDNFVSEAKRKQHTNIGNTENQEKPFSQDHNLVINFPAVIELKQSIEKV